MRVFIYGSPGAGKTTLALLLSKKLDLPVHHLDGIFFHPGGTSRDFNIGASEVAKLVQEEHWIIEGNHGVALEIVAPNADRIVVLKIGRWRGLLRLIIRRLRTPTILSDKGPGGGQQILPMHLVRYALFIHPQLEPHHLAKIAGAASGDVCTFEKPEAALAWFK